MSCLLGENRDIFFPKLSEALNLARFSDIAVRYLAQLGFEAFECASEDEARDRAAELIARKNGRATFSKATPRARKILKSSLPTPRRWTWSALQAWA